MVPLGRRIRSDKNEDAENITSMEKAIESHIQLRKCRRLVLFPMPFQGHINPMMQLANILFSKGFSITIIHTEFNRIDPSKHPYFTFHSIPDGLSENEATTDDIIAILTNLAIKTARPFRECLAKLLSDVSEEPIACVIADSLWHFTRALCEDFKLPVVVLRCNNVNAFFALASLPLLHQKGYLTYFKPEEPVPDLPHLKVKDLPVVQKSNQEEYNQLVNKVVEQVKTCSGLIFNSAEALEKDGLATLSQKFLIPVFPIGPFHKYFIAPSSSLLPEDESCISWLNAQKLNSVLYVSLGSLAAINETGFVEIAWGLASSNRPFLWVIRPGVVEGSEYFELLPKGFLEMIQGRGLIVKWAPQQKVLAHPAIGGFWTHTGWNSTLESICEGVPMICQPCFADQFVNARYVSDVWRIGIHLEGKLLRRDIVRAIKRLMIEEEGKELRERTLGFKHDLDIIFSHEGSSNESLDSLVAHILSFEV